MLPSTRSLLKDLEKTARKFWNISPETGKFLHQLILDRNIKSALEIGTSNGYSAIWTASALKQTGGHLTTIESHKERHSLATLNIKKANLSPQITQLLGHAPENLPSTNKKYDLIFLDATKYEHSQYLKTLKPKLKTNGIIITDNVLSHKKALTLYLKSIKNDNSFTSHLLNIDTGLLVSVKT